MKSNTIKRSEEIQHIIDRMPTKFGYWITCLVLFVVIAIFTLAWEIKYHDILTGLITINTENAPIKLVANTSGKIKLNVKTNDSVLEGQYIAYIQNTANIDDVKEVSREIESFISNSEDKLDSKRKTFYTKKYTLGDITTKYFQFLNALTQVVNFQKDGYYQEQERSLTNLMDEYNKMGESVLQKNLYRQKYAALFKKFFDRDSLLLRNKVISEAEADKARLNYLDALNANESSDFEVSQLFQQIESTINKKQQLSIEKKEKALQLQLELIAAHSELKDYIKLWEEKYVFKSPIDGKVQFLKFWVNNHFVQNGEQIFTVISKDDHIYGQVNLPNLGSGKVNLGQDVIIKLDNYPYMEYGSIRGKINEISLTTHTEKSEDGSTENYLVRVKLPDRLKTSYGKFLNSKHEITGTAEIIANERRLLQRVFDNLKYLINQ